MSAYRNTFKKAERLCSKKIINQLFGNDDVVRVTAYPLILIYKKENLNSTYPAQILFSVGKKYVRKAVDRNRIKRQLREMYRPKKHLLYEKLEGADVQLALLLLFAGREQISYNQLQLRFEKIFDHLMDSF